MVPKVAGRSGQWMRQKGEDLQLELKAFVYFLFFWMVEDVVRCKRYCEKINWYFLRNEERSDECRGK